MCVFCSKVCLGQHALQMHAQQCRGPSASPVTTSASITANQPEARFEQIQEDSPSTKLSSRHQQRTNPMDIIPFSINSVDGEHPSDSDYDPSSHSDHSPVNRINSTNPIEMTGLVDMITDDEFDSIIDGFMEWLGQGPVSVVEQMVKKRRLTTDKQVTPVRQNLRHLFTMVSELQSIDIADLTLSSLTKLETVKAIMHRLEQRQVGPARIHALVLLLKKICVYLCSMQSNATMLYISPQTMPSWHLIDSHCSQATKKRKMRQRDRMVLHTVSLPQALAPSQSVQTSLPTQPGMTSEELTTVIHGCLGVLDELMTALSTDASISITKEVAKRYTEHFITVCFALLLAPRQQVFRQLTMEHLVRQNDNYIIRMSAEQSKIGQPILLRIPNVMTSKFEFYLSRVLPSMRNNNNTSHLFVQRDGEPRQDFSLATRAVTLQLIGRPVNAHEFRHCIATLFYAHPDSNDTTMKQLAETMNHDSQTQMQYYVHQQRLQAQERLQSMLITQTVANSFC
jgi:hypothetical protein